MIISLCICIAMSITACSQRDNAKEPPDLAGTSVSEVQKEESTSPQQEYRQTSGAEIPTDYQAYFDKYLLAWNFHNPFEQSFGEGNYLSDYNPYLLFMGCAALEHRFNEYNEKYGSNGLFPADIVESTVARYFLISVEQYRERLKRRGETNDWAKNNEYYDAAKNSYFFDGGYGGASMSGIITAVKEENDIIVISCDWYDVEDNFCFSHTVTILKGDKDDEFMYIENHVTGAADKQANTEPPEGTVEISFDAPVVNEMGTILTETVDFSIYLPRNWTVAGLEISEDGRKVAEVLPARMITFEDTDVLFAEAVTIRDITAGQYPGKCYHMQTDVAAEGLTVRNNELIYCLNTGDRMILIAFYPVYGIGIGTQNQQFASFLDSIKLL